ncbi:MAG: hypothetical protein GY719_43005 [bacterium]|nr:hypothetical protein [bacterium]
MDRERWRRIDAVFAAALELDPEERATFLTTVCGADEALRREVESLLAADESAGEFLETPVLLRGVLRPQARGPSGT